MKKHSDWYGSPFRPATTSTLAMMTLALIAPLSPSEAGTTPGVTAGYFKNEVLFTATAFAGNAGSTDWVGFLEFDLTPLAPGPHDSVSLFLADKGGTGNTATTAVFYFSGDGVETQGDLTIPAQYLFDITRPLSGETTEHDVTDAVNDLLAAQATHIGFRFHGTQSNRTDAFGFEYDNNLVWDATSVSVPLPSREVSSWSGVKILFR